MPRIAWSCLTIGIILVSCGEEALRYNPPYLAPSTDLVDFGQVEIGEQEIATVYFFNRGERPIEVEEPTGDFKAGVFQVVMHDSQVDAGTDLIVRVIFAPQGEASYDTVITFPNNSTNTPSFELSLRGTGINPDPCYGVVCQTPPNACYFPQGECVDGNCVYPLKIDDTPCQDPAPPNSCFNAIGRCLQGACIYQVNNTATCNDDDPCTLGDACTDGICQGAPRDCSQIPVDVCSVAGPPGTLLRYEPTGFCDDQGSCQYPATEITCEYGCAGGQCAGDPCAGGCDDGNQCTVDYCETGVACRHDEDSGAACITSSGECPTGTCNGTACLPTPDVTCEAEYDVDLCQTATVAGVCTGSGNCVVDEVPPEYQCDGCNGICLQCYFIELCIPL